MINFETQLKIQSFVDGELPEGEASEVAALIARDSDASGLMGELKNTRLALRSFEKDLKLPESTDFYWSKIRREIERLEPLAEAASPVPNSFLTSLKRFLIPAGAFAAACLALLLTVTKLGGPIAAQASEMELVSGDMAASTFRSEAEGITMIWLYHRGNDSEFTGADSSGTVPVQ
jgi:anti-sigma factor RsiW